MLFCGQIHTFTYTGPVSILCFISVLVASLTVLTVRPLIPTPTVPDDPADAVCAQAGAQAAAVHLRLQREVQAAARPAHAGLARARHQEAAGGAGHLPAGRRRHGILGLRLAVRHPHQPGKRWRPVL